MGVIIIILQQNKQGKNKKFRNIQQGLKKE